MTTVKILLKVSIDNANDWLGLEDYKKYQGATSDLEAFKIMAELEECSSLNLLVNLCDQSTPSAFLAVESLERQTCPVCQGNKESVVFHNTGADNSNHYSSVLKCRFCGGDGVVPFEQHKNFRKGQLLKELRLSKRETLRDCALRLGLTPAEVSKVEQGK